jgi:hypothetical protein
MLDGVRPGSNPDAARASQAISSPLLRYASKPISINVVEESCMTCAPAEIISLIFYRAFSPLLALSILSPLISTFSTMEAITSPEW